MATQYRIYLDGNGGEMSPGVIWFSTNSGRFWYKDANDNTVYITDANDGTVSGQELKATRTCWKFLGFYASKATGAAQYVNKSGQVTAAFFSAARSDDSDLHNSTLYAKWQRISYRVILDANGGSGGTTRLYTKADDSDTIYDNSTCSAGHEVNSITAPTLGRGYTYNGHHARKDGGTTYIAYTSSITSALRTWAASNDKEDLRIYANWTVNHWKITIDRNGGKGGTSQFYTVQGAMTERTFYKNTACTNSNAITAITPPTRTGYELQGCDFTVPGTENIYTYIDGTGEIKAGLYSYYDNRAQDATPRADEWYNISLVAKWTAHTWTLSFDLHGGTGTATAKTVTYGANIGTLPANPTRQGFVFEGWYVDGAPITTTTKWLWDGDRQAIARWRGAFGDVVDYFNLDDGTTLRAIESSSNEGLPRVDGVANGKFASSAMAAAALMNPSVSYAFVSQYTREFWIWDGAGHPVWIGGLAGIILGQAFGSGGRGYMITSVTFTTAAGQRPQMTVTATANEGADAINRWPISIDVSPRSVAQNLMGAFSIPSGSYLNSLTLTAACDPVVVMQDLQPVASDVVRGRIEVSAEIVQTTATATAPTAANGFELTASSINGTEAGFRVYSLTARRAL